MILLMRGCKVGMSLDWKKAILILILTFSLSIDVKEYVMYIFDNEAVLAVRECASFKFHQVKKV